MSVFFSRTRFVPLLKFTIFLIEINGDHLTLFSFPCSQVPMTLQEWGEIRKRFFQRWNFPRCCGAIDGKHVVVKRPPCSGSQFYNYKQTYSVILFAMVDADYCFTYIDVGGNGRASDSAIFRDSTLNICMENDSLGMPENSIIVGDDAFPLRINLMKPYSKRGLTDDEKIFNYRLSRARRVVEIQGVFKAY